MSLSRTNFKPILARLAAAVLNRSEQGKNLPQPTQALIWLQPGSCHHWSEGTPKQTVQLSGAFLLTNS